MSTGKIVQYFFQTHNISQNKKENAESAVWWIFYRGDAEH